MADTTLGEVTTKIGSVGATPRGAKQSYAEYGIALHSQYECADGRFESNGLARIDDEQAVPTQERRGGAGSTFSLNHHDGRLCGAARAIVADAWLLPGRSISVQ